MNPQKYAFFVDGYRRKFVEAHEYDELMAYCDKLIDFLPCLPKDVENLREANAEFANQNFLLQQEHKNLCNEINVLRGELNVCKIGRNAAANAWDEAQHKIGYLELALQREQENTARLQDKLDYIKSAI